MSTGDSGEVDKSEWWGGFGAGELPPDEVAESPLSRGSAAVPDDALVDSHAAVKKGALFWIVVLLAEMLILSVFSHAGEGGAFYCAFVTMVLLSICLIESETRVGVAMVLLTVFLIGATYFSTWFTELATCGQDTGPVPLPGSPAAAFCHHAPQALWEWEAFILPLGVLVVGYWLSRNRTHRWPLAVALLVAAGLLFGLNIYASSLSLTPR
jgi:hypothetical protein